MKKTLLLVLLASSFFGFSQTEKYGNQKIGQWAFEEFPLHYLVKPANAKLLKNRYTGQLEGYQEYNDLGQVNGLTVTMRTDGIYPSSATYKYKGEIVYHTSFFPSSNKAQLIENFNENGNENGKTIYRTLKPKGGYEEDIKVYEDGNLTNDNGKIYEVKKLSASYNENILVGEFKIKPSEYSKKTFEGVSENGYLKEISEIYNKFGGGVGKNTVEFLNDEIILKKDLENGKYKITNYPLISKPKITNSENLIKKYGNLYSYPYLFIKGDFKIEDLIKITSRYYPKPLETILNYNDDLLNGNFSFRTYIDDRNDRSWYSYSGEYYDIEGKAIKGKLSNISKTSVKMDIKTGEIISEKKTEYLFQNNEIIQNDYFPKISENAVASKTLKLEYPVLVTKSIDYNKKYGYFYFDEKFEFYLERYIKTITTKTDKPIERKINESNGLLNGNFEFKENNISYKVFGGTLRKSIKGNIIGIANLGIITNVSIAYKSKRDWINSSDDKFTHDKVEYLINENKIKIKYYLANKEIETKQFKILKNRKLTNLKDLSEYNDYIYYDNDSKLASILDNLSFLEVGEPILSKKQNAVLEVQSKIKTYKQNKEKVNKLYVTESQNVYTGTIRSIKKKHLFKAYEIVIRGFDENINLEKDEIKKAEKLTAGINLTEKIIELFGKNTKAIEKSLKNKSNTTEILSILNTK